MAFLVILLFIQICEISTVCEQRSAATLAAEISAGGALRGEPKFSSHAGDTSGGIHSGLSVVTQEDQFRPEIKQILIYLTTVQHRQKEGEMKRKWLTGDIRSEKALHINNVTLGTQNILLLCFTMAVMKGH